MTYPVKLSEPDRSPAGLFWSLAVVLTAAWVYFAYSNPDFTPTSQLHTPLLSSLSILIIAAAVWHWSGRWWVLLLIFTSPFILWPLHTTILDTLPLLGLLIYTFFAPQADYAPNYANQKDEHPHSSMPKFLAEIAAIMLLLIQPQSAGFATFIIWLRSEKKWWLAGLFPIILYSTFASVKSFYIYIAQLSTTLPSTVIPSSYLPFTFWPWGIVIGIVLFWIAIGQRDVLIGASSSVFFSPTLPNSAMISPTFTGLLIWDSLTLGLLFPFAIVTAVRLPKLFLLLSIASWGILLIANI